MAKEQETVAEASTEHSPDSASEQQAAKTYAGMSRRTLCIGVGGAAAMLALGGLKFTSSKVSVRPPGGQDEEHLISACIRCEKCVEVCPHNVIAPAHIENGILGMRSPVMDFSSSLCDWCKDANGERPLCEQVCPTDALKLPEGATIQNYAIGKAVLDQDNCLAYNRGMTGCRSCYDACNYEAMELDDAKRPYVLVDKCNGCGACQSVCISLKSGSISKGATERAIIVRPLSIVEA